MTAESRVRPQGGKAAFSRAMSGMKAAAVSVKAYCQGRRRGTKTMSDLLTRHVRLQAQSEKPDVVALASSLVFG